MGHTFNKHGWADRELNIDRQNLLKVLRENREKHIVNYKEALAGYRDAAKAKIEDIMLQLKHKIDELKDNQLIDGITLSFHLPAPESHEKTYDQIIKMMEMCVDDTVALTASQFSCFIMDDWDWKEDWNTNNAFYMARGKQLLK